MKSILVLARIGLMGLLLAFAVALQAQPGGWSVNFSQYQYNMTITAQIQVNGIPNHALNNHLAVFSKGQIRGYATPVAINGQAYYFITAYANTYQGDTLYFRAFVGSAQKIYESTDTLIFRHQNIVGKISAPYQVHLFLGARPLIYSLSEVNYGINACTDVLNVQSSDNINSEGNGLTYSIIGGADASKFSINPVTGVVSWYNFTPVFNPPGDANGDNKYELKIKVTDADGLSDVQNLTVKMVQESPLNPLVCPPSFTLNTSADGLGDCTAKTDQTQIYSLNPCDLYGITYTLTGATTGSGSGQIPLTQLFQKGVTTATYLRGANSQCNFTITVVDDEVPTITCPTDKTVNTLATPPCAAVVNNIDAVYADNCTSAFLTYTYTGAGTGTGTGQLSGTTFPVGQTQVVYKATDAANLTSTCTFSITVIDAMLPVALCKNATVQLNQSGTATIAASDIDNGSNDECGIGSLSVAPNSFTCANAGNNPVTLTVTDVNNNISTCTATVLVKSLSLGNQVFKDLNRNGLYDAGDAGVNGVLCNLYADNGNGALDAADGAPVATFTTSTLNGQVGSYLFSLLCPGDYIVEIAPSNFNVGGPLYDNTLQSPLVSSPFNGAPDPDNNLDHDDNGEAVSGFGVASAAITLALNLEPDNDGDTDKNTNLSLDFGFKTAVSVSIGDVTLAEGTGGTTTAYNFTVTRSDNVDALSLTVNTQNGTAIGASDYTSISNGTVSFTAGGSLTATVTVLVNQDNMVEPNETFTVDLTDPNGNVFFTDASGLGTINNDDSAVLTLSGGTAQTEGAAITFTATLNNPVQGGFSVAYTSNDGTATTADTDYSDNDGSLTFAGTTGEIKTITVNTTTDNKVELDETFTVALGTITGAPAGVSTAGSPQTGTITNDDAATVSIAANISQAEATSPQAFSVTLSNPVDVPVTVQFSTSNGTATTADNDYVSVVDQTVTFPAGSITAQTANVTINNDNKVEADEVYNVAIGTLSASGRNVTLGTSSRTGTILNDDAAVLTLSGGIAQNEGNTGTTSYAFTATLNNPVQGGFTANYTTNDGTATSGSDYNDNDGSLSFAGTAGEAKTVTVNVNSDITVELDETFTVVFGTIIGAPSGLSTAGSPQIGTITNDDAATVSIAANISQAEATSPQAFSVTLSNPVDVPISVQFSTSNGTATTADNDYAGITAQTVTFPSGSTTAQIANVTINNDNKVEADEVYNVAIGSLSVSGRNVTLGTASRTGTILNDDAAIVTLSGGIAKNEGNTGTTSYVFTATLDNPVQGGFAVAYTTNDGTATTTGTDYTDNDGALSFAGTAGEAQTVTVNVTGDVTVELDETFTVALGTITGSPAGVSTAGSPQTGIITNDDAATVSIAANISQAEATSPQAFSVTLSNPVDVPVTVQFSTSNGTATTADNDYVGITAQTVTFPAGSAAAQTANVTINNDNKVEADELYNAAIASLSASGRNVTLGTTSRTGTILNDDAAVVTLSGGIAQNEGNTGTTAYVFTATLNNPVQGGFTANYTTNDGTATTADNDYTDNDGALSFAGTAGEAKTFTVLVNGDLNIEANETFQTAITNLTGIPTPPAVTTAGSPQTATITNDELDFGDAPTAAQSGFAGSYQSTLADNGARHGAAPGGLRLGASLDADLDGQPNATASGDGADEDGVTLPAVLVTGNNASATVIASAAGVLNAWVDFNRDGDWADAGEQVFTNQSVSAGSNSLSFAVPAVVSVGTSFARFRLATAPGASFDGPAVDGEVEDYVVSLVNTQFTINDPVVTEGNAGTSNLSFVISRTVNSGACSVNYAITGGTATTADNDYQTLAAGTASFTAGGALSQTINVVVNGDLKVELNETVDMTLSNPVNGSILDGAGTGTITNDDAATITITNPAVTEGDVSTTVSMSFVLNMSNPSDANVELNFATQDGSATTANNDYLSVNGNLIFSPGQQTKIVTVTANGDCAIEANETFALQLSALLNNGRNVSLSGGGATLNGTGTLNNDDALPVITCPGNISKNVDAGTCTTSVLLPLPTTSSICGTSTLEFRYRTVDALNNPTGAFTAFAPSSNNTVVFNSGRYEVEWRVTDGSGNSSCSFFLTVVDNQPPTITCPANQFVNANTSCTGLVGAWTPVSVNDNCTPIGQIVVTQTPVPSTILTGHGSAATVTLTARDLSNNTATCTFTVTLRDVTPPVAKCKNATANLGSNGLVTVLPASVDNLTSDNCTFALTLTPNTFSCSNIGQNTVTLKATDAGGNTSTCTSKVTVVDNTPPMAKCKNATIFLNSVGQATLTPADVNNGSSDNCSIGTLTISKSLFNCSEISGTNPVTLTLTDVNGNSSSCLAYVTVKDNLAPTAVCENVTVTLNQNGKVTVYPATLADNSFDNCSVFSYSPTVKVYTTANIGNNNLTITVKDFTGNASTCVSVVTVLPNVINNDDRAGEDQQAATAPVHLSLFPNPTTGDVTLQFDLPADQEFGVMVFDLSGRLVYNLKSMGVEGENTLPIRLSGVASGIYLLDFQTDAVKSHVRLVVQE
jgi:hypothetical protein